ncbi:hypothetical protein [Salinibacter altiplanensis]|uniref:hypothetical protein n=1 Tax=Salinibacter altiplanensis TaxID=1803181 RepID=UPI000C9EFE4F|nr:hypothetical protein [Salinibacter altiplanensis]
MSSAQIRAEAEKERRRRLPAVIDSDGRAFHRGKEIDPETVDELPAGDGYRAIDFTPPDSDTL